MTDKPPPSWFGKQYSGQEDSADFKRRKAALLKELPSLLERQKGRGRAQKFLPYLLVRSVLGDRGDRPINLPFWESPDIWTAEGDPSATPEIPPDHGGTVKVGVPSTVYAHVWNLGFAPLAGIFVEFYWFDPSVGIDGTHANLIGVARCELAGRGMQGSHKLVKCPKPWVATMQNGGHECLVVRVSGIGDPLGNNAWKPWLNRHIAQRNISVVSVGADISRFIASLNATRHLGGRLQLIQVGAHEGALAGKIAAPGLKIADLETHVLGEIGAAGKIVKSNSHQLTPAMLAPVHALAAGGVPPPPTARGDNLDKVVDVGAAFSSLRMDRATSDELTHRIRAAEQKTAKNGHVADLFSATARFNPLASPIKAPGRGEAQVLRLAQFDGDQLVGGHTIVVAGK